MTRFHPAFKRHGRFLVGNQLDILALDCLLLNSLAIDRVELRLEGRLVFTLL
jgi:hypothetical protein